MKHQCHHIQILRAGLIMLAAAICLSGAAGETLAGSITVTDALGRKVVLTVPVRRLVALNSDIIEVLRTLKATHLLVGVFSQIEREPEFWGGLANLPKVGSWRDPDPEAVARLQPDLVIGYGKNPGPAFEKKAKELDIQVLRLDLYRLATLEREVRLLGDLLDRQQQAKAFCNWHRRLLDMIQSRLSALPHKPRVYLESYSDFHAAGPRSGANEMCILAGGRNIAASLAIPYPQITPEWVMAQNPDVIVKAASYGNGYAAADASGFNQRRDAILRRPAWHYVPAVQNSRVHVMDSAIWTGPRAVIGVAYMVQWLYPGFFKDLEPQAIHKAYLENFQGIAYKGVFVCDSLAKDGQSD
jgi:iron complex transport system substrate-binding protein